MKKSEYEKPYAVIEEFTVSDRILTLSDFGIGEGDSEDFENMFQ